MPGIVGCRNLLYLVSQEEFRILPKYYFWKPPVSDQVAYKITIILIFNFDKKKKTKNESVRYD